MIFCNYYDRLMVGGGGGAEAAIAPPVICAALDVGSHVLAEKPSCVNVADFRFIVEAADRKGLHVMLALANRLNPEAVEARRLVAEGAIGEVYGMELSLVADQTRLTREGYRDRWEAQKARAGGGHLVWLGIHWLDLAQHITGTNIKEVCGFTARVGSGGRQLDVEDSASAAFRLDNGTLGTLTSAYFTDRGYNSHMKIWGSQGWIHIETFTPGVDPEVPMRCYSHAADDPQPGVVHEYRVGTEQERGYTPWVGACVGACLGRGPPPISNADSLRAVATVHAIYDSEQVARTLTV
eukprot:SAG25_NODE_3361_length_1114_cov_1.029557_1_plen_295_part_00